MKKFEFTPVSTTLSSPVKVHEKKEFSIDQVVLSSENNIQESYKYFQNIDGSSSKRIEEEKSPRLEEGEVNELNEDQEKSGPNKTIIICRQLHENDEPRENRHRESISLRNELNQSRNGNKQNVEELAFSNWELFKISFFPNILLSSKLKLKLNLLKEGELFLDKYIDVYQMIKRFQETENLKHVVLNNRQIPLFNNLSKPFIELSSDLKKPKDRKKSFSHEIKEAWKGRKTGNLTDKKLLEMFYEGKAIN